MCIKVSVKFDVKETMIESFIRILESVKKDLPSVEGCQGVIVMRQRGRKNQFSLIESWSNTELHQAHVNRLVEDGSWDLIMTHLNSDPDSAFWVEM